SKHGSLSVRRTASARRAKQARRAGGVPPAPKRKKASRTDTGAAALFVLPSFAGVCVFVLLPFLDTVRRSFTNALGTKSVGAANYTSVLSNDAFRLAAYNTALFGCMHSLAALRQLGACPACPCGQGRRTHF
ncbi:MAG: hypothetical protein RR825_00460, partial [Ruthenibacterium sp.]